MNPRNQLHRADDLRMKQSPANQLSGLNVRSRHVRCYPPQTRAATVPLASVGRIASRRSLRRLFR